MCVAYRRSPSLAQIGESLARWLRLRLLGVEQTGGVERFGFTVGIAHGAREIERLRQSGPGLRPAALACGEHAAHAQRVHHGKA